MSNVRIQHEVQSGISETLGKCHMLGCNNEARFLIRSLRSEVYGEAKWLYVCDECEKRLAAENAQVFRLAKRKGMSVAEHVEFERRDRVETA